MLLFWTDNDIYVRAARNSIGRSSCAMVREGPVLIVVHRNGFTMLNVLCCVAVPKFSRWTKVFVGSKTGTD